MEKILEDMDISVDQCYVTLNSDLYEQEIILFSSAQFRPSLVKIDNDYLSRIVGEIEETQASPERDLGSNSNISIIKESVKDLTYLQLIEKVANEGRLFFDQIVSSQLCSNFEKRVEISDKPVAKLFDIKDRQHLKLSRRKAEQKLSEDSKIYLRMLFMEFPKHHDMINSYYSISTSTYYRLIKDQGNDSLMANGEDKKRDESAQINSLEMKFIEDFVTPPQRAITIRDV
jgi:hypothetical protein